MFTEKLEIAKRNLETAIFNQQHVLTGTGAGVLSKVSDKIDNINPVSWRPEYAWLYPIALADGTFEAAPKLVWGKAYAVVRPDWNIEQVGQLLDEFERVGFQSTNPQTLQKPCDACAMTR